MRSLAHQLAGALVFNLKVDVGSRIFVSGKSSDAIGHTLQPLLDPLMEQYNDALDTYNIMMNLASPGETNYDSRPSMNGGQEGVSFQAQICAIAMKWATQVTSHDGHAVPPVRFAPASLLLVDRWQDLFTPIASTYESDLFSALNASRSPETKTKNGTGSPPFWEDVFALAEAHQAAFNISSSVLAAREQALLQLLAVPSVGLRECLPYIMSFLTDNSKETDSNSDSARGFDPCRGPGCFLSTLLLAALTLYLVGLGQDNEDQASERASQLSETLPLLVEALVHYVLHRAQEKEIAMLAAHGLLGSNSHIVESILTFRRGEVADRGGTLPLRVCCS